MRTVLEHTPCLLHYDLMGPLPLHSPTKTIKVLAHQQVIREPA